MLAIFTVDTSTFRRRFTLKPKTMEARSAKTFAGHSAVGPAIGAAVTCLNAGELGASLPTLNAGSPIIGPTQVTSQWTIHQTILYTTNAVGRWVESGRTQWIYGLTDGISPVSSWGSSGWWFRDSAGWHNTNSVDWTMTGRTGWWGVVHQIYWYDNGWGEGAQINARHYDYTAPGGGGGGPANLATAYNMCYVE